MLREAVGNDVVEEREHNGYPSITYRVGQSEVSASRSATGPGRVLCSIFMAHQTTEAGYSLFERVAEAVRQRWPEAEIDREVI